MARSTVEQHPVAQESRLLAPAAWGILWFLAALILAAALGAEWFTEKNLLSMSLVFYTAATALYLWFGVSGAERAVPRASMATWAGLLANTLAVGHRWYIAGRPPFSNIYEMLLSFVWTVAALTLLLERRYAVKVVGTVTMPLAVLGVILMQLLPSEVRPLVPALQSTWLHIHVTLAMLAYAAFAVSFALAAMFLIQDGLGTDTFLAATSGLLAAIYIGVVSRLDASGGLRVVAWDPGQGREMFYAEGRRLLVVIPDLGWLFVLVLAAVVAPLALWVWARKSGREELLPWADRAFFAGALFQVVGFAAFLLRARDGYYPGLQEDGLFPTRLPASPFLLAGLAGGLFASLLYLLLTWRRPALERMLPGSATLDRLTYKTIGIAFPLLTLMIAAGAYWANQTWGSYWSWDPKETWALITWLVYAGYLHMRITRGWRGRRAAYFAILGFAVVLFTFFGVTYLLPGLHAYA